MLGLVDLVGEEPRAAVSPPDPPVMLFIGRHIPDKRIDALPAALEVARRRLPEISPSNRGHPVLRPTALGAAADAAGVTDVVDFLGRVDDDELSRLLIGASVLVNPSAREGFGLVVAEAAAAGTPSIVVAGPDNAAAELVHVGVNGEVVADAGAAALGDAVVRVVAAGESLRRSTLAWFLRERVERSLGRSVDQILERIDDEPELTSSATGARADERVASGTRGAIP